MKDVAKFWLAMSFILAGIAGLVLGAMAVLTTLGLSEQGAGLALGALLVVGVLVSFSWLVYEGTA